MSGCSRRTLKAQERNHPANAGAQTGGKIIKLLVIFVFNMTRAQFKKVIDACSSNNVTIVASGSHYRVDPSRFAYDDDTVQHINHMFWYGDIEHVFEGDVTSISIPTNTVGSDPEFFFKKDGKIVPSIDVIPPHDEHVVRDGFQGELNPLAASCRQSAGYYVGTAMTQAAAYAKDAGAKILLAVGVTVSDDVWKKAPVTIKRFGCNPTINAHEAEFKRVTGLRERFRAAGGHIHYSCPDSARDNANSLVTVWDFIVGNTFVLIDRDPNNARRRINYGRAGEYRIKPYGIEYRVLSNFWLRSYTLWSMAIALMRNAYAIYSNKSLYKKLLEVMDVNAVRKAINNNDYDLALKNFEVYMKFVIDNRLYAATGLTFLNIDTFYKWVTMKNPVVLLDIDTVEKSLSEWRHRAGGAGVGFERFLQNIKSKVS